MNRTTRDPKEHTMKPTDPPAPIITSQQLLIMDRRQVASGMGEMIDTPIGKSFVCKADLDDGAEEIPTAFTDAAMESDGDGGGYQ